MNGETKSATAIACSSKSSPTISKRDITNSGSGPPFDADSTSLVADPLGLCPFGVKSTRMGKVNAGQSKEDSSPGTVDELVRSRYEISDLLDNWEMPDAALKPELVKSGENHLNSSNVMDDNESSLSTVNATLPVNADISTVTVSPSMDKLPGSAEILPVPKFEQVTAAMPSRDSFVENVKCEVPRPANINRAGEHSYESTGRSIATNSAVEGQKLSSIKPLNASQGLDTPGKLSNFGKATDTAAGQRKPTSEVSKPMANVSIHFSKKTAYEDSDEDEGMGIAISVTSVPNKEATASEQSSSLESVAEPFIDVLPPVESETPQSNRVVPEINDVCSTPKTVSGDTSQASESKVAKPSSDRKRKGWYSMLSATYKSRSIEYKRIFKDIPSSERLMVDYSCALQKDILCHGRMYVSRDWVCFYANIFSWETSVVVRTKDIAKLTKEKTARVIPNAIQICTSDDKTYFFASLASRDKTFLVLDRLRKCAIDDQPMSLQELWQWVHYSYGEDLGLSDGDDDYISLSSEEKIDFQTQVQQKLNEQCGDGLSSAGSTADLGSLESVADLESSVSESIPAKGAKQKLFKNSPEKSVPKVGLENPNVGVKGEVDPGSESDAEDSSESQKSDDKQSSFDACSTHEHFEIPAVDENYDVPVDTLFQHLFTDSPVFRNFLNNRKTFDVVLAPWPSEADSNGMKVRNISYTLSLTNALGPKTSPSTERQIMHCQSQPGEFYLVDAEVINGKIPYGEDFYVMSRYCLSRVTNARCRLRITSQIKYRKNVWGFVRNIIDKNVTAGIIEAFTALADVLKQECSQSVPTRKQDQRRQLSAGKATVPLSSTAATVAAVVRGKEEARPLITSDSLIRILFFGLILLMMFNTFLLFKLWSVESRLYEERFHRSRVTNGQSTGANVDTVQVLEGIASLLSELRETLLSHNKLYMKESVVCDQEKCT